MPAENLPPGPAGPADAGDQLAEVSRRSLLRGAAGAGAAGLAASSLIGAFAGPALAGPAHQGGSRPQSGPEHDGRARQDVIVHLRDSRSGEMDIFAGTSHTKVRDRELAARLVSEL
ncbi:MAG TPA: hypothetical protein VGI64_22545 [Streptosporangiaceae bacterium]|jgi:hypothetical protein